MRKIREDQKEIIRIAVPAVLESLIAVIITTIDTRMISPLGAGPVSAVSMTTQPKLIFLSIFFALGTTASVFVSQALGKKDRKEANAYFHSILRITLIGSLILGALIALLADPIMRLCSRQQETIGTSVQFLRIIMGFMVFNTVSIVINASLRSIGKTNVTLIACVAMGVVDLVFNYLLIEGHLGFPRLEVAGDAIATVAGTAASAAVGLIYLSRHSDFLTLRGLFSRGETNAEIRKNIVSKSSNVVFENLFTRIGFLISGIIVSTLPADTTAVYFVAMILLNYSFAFGDGLQSTVTMLVGRSVGAGETEKIRKYVRWSRLTGFGIGVVLSVVYILGSRFFFSCFFKDQESISLGMQYSWFAAALSVLQIVRIVNVAAMRGIGNVKIPRIIATICILILNPICGWLLTIVLEKGVWGIWWSSMITQTVWFALSYFLSDREIRKTSNEQAKGAATAC